VTNNISVTCNALKKCIDAALPLPEGHATNNAIALQDICPQIVNSYTLLLSAVNAIPSNTQDSRALNNAVNSLTALFLTFLGSIHKLALDEITRQEGEERSKRRKPKSNTKATKKASEPDQASFTESAALLARTIRRFITSLDLNRITHCRIFKSVLSALLDHVGSSLSLLVFADPQQLDEVDAPIEQPCGLQHVAHVDTSTALAVAELEGPYLICILKPALGHLQQSRLDMLIRSREIIAGSRTDIDNEALLQKIEKRLGDTLLRAVFGDEDQGFREAFSRQASPEDDVAEETVRDAREEDDKSKWYIGQLWELLGWDMLSGKLAGRE
jgi:hypothetical protein